MPSWFQTMEARNFPANFWNLKYLVYRMSRYAATPLIVALSPSHSNITRFLPWSPFATGCHNDSDEKIAKFTQTTGNLWRLWSALRHFGTRFAKSFCMSKSSWMMYPTRSRKMPSCLAIDLEEIRMSYKFISLIWSVISGVVIVLGPHRQGVIQVKKSQRLN